LQQTLQRVEKAKSTVKVCQFALHPKAPLCKGGCHANSVTGGLRSKRFRFRIGFRRNGNIVPQQSLRHFSLWAKNASSLYTREPWRSRAGGFIDSLSQPIGAGFSSRRGGSLTLPKLFAPYAETEIRKIYVGAAIGRLPASCGITHGWTGDARCYEGVILPIRIRGVPELCRSPDEKFPEPAGRYFCKARPFRHHRILQNELP